jgi:hypothetical protein
LGHAQDHLVGVPVGPAVHRQSEEERHDHAALAADHVADGQKQAGHARKQQARSHGVHHRGESWSIDHRGSRLLYDDVMFPVQ